MFLDQRQTGYKLDDLRMVLNNGMNSRYSIDRRPFRLVEFANSKETGAVQIADILLGSVAYLKNDHHKVAGAKPAKVELARHVMNKARLKESVPNTPYNQSSFTVWNFMLS